MSYEYKRPDVQVVVCDLCGDFSWISDRHWREMPQRTGEQPIHLCQICQRVAVWCPAHQQYHLLDAFHRRGCVDCGGLFTSVVRDQITRCPSCRRAAGDQPAQPAQREIGRRRSLVQLLFAPRGSHRQ
ncbi:MAG: hypothetical protein ACJ8CR_12565 [Roseiflexaceae bacterium]|jgi:hypothetical protein